MACDRGNSWAHCGSSFSGRFTLSQRLSGKLGLSLGCDLHLSYENLVDALKNPSRYTISGTNYLLVELSDFSFPPSVSQGLRRLLASGVVPIITHPERNLALRTTPQRVLEWVGYGCLVQITANSLTGWWGRQAKETAEWLMTHAAVHVVATDAHGVASRPWSGQLELLGRSAIVAGGGEPKLPAEAMTGTAVASVRWCGSECC
jgi:tyrosine-protein phosphatase YwqE